MSKDERAWFFSFKEKRAMTVSERIFLAGENSRVFVSTNLILFTALLAKNGRELQENERGKKKTPINWIESNKLDSILKI